MRELTKKSKLAHCKICHKNSHYISRNRLCADCLMERVKLANLEMKHKQGPIYEKWRIKILQGLEKGF